jgi:hypothetical protein
MGVIVRALAVILGWAVSLAALPASAELKGADADFVVPAVLWDINPATGLGSIPPEYESCPLVAPSNTIGNFFNPIGFISALANDGDVLYGLEWDGSDIFFYKFDSSGCVEGSRVGLVESANMVKFVNLEGLAYVPEAAGTAGSLYSVDFDTAAHEGQLVQIDPNTGAGTAVGDHMARDVRVVGLTYDPGLDLLFGVTSGWESRPSELLTIDYWTGVETLVGATGTLAHTLESLARIGERLFSAGTQLRELDPNTGTASVAIGGNYNGTVWGMSFENPCGDVNNDRSINGADATTFRAFLADPNGSPLPTGGPGRCTTIGSPRPCDILDVVVLLRYLASTTLAPGLAPVCTAVFGL